MTPPEMEGLYESLSDAAWIRRLALGLAGDASAADDLVQDAWLVALSSERRGAGEVGPGWFASVLRHLAWKKRRGAARLRDRELAGARPEAQPSAAELVERAAVHRGLVDAVMQLDEPYRETVLLRFLEEQPPREIARRQEVSVRTVNTRLTRGLEHLRRRLDGEYGGRDWLAALLPVGFVPQAIGGAGSVAAATEVAVSSTTFKLAVVAVATLSAVGLWRAVAPGQGGPGASAALSSEPPVETLAEFGYVDDEPGAAEELQDDRVSVTPPAAVGTLVVAGRLLELAYPGLREVDEPAAGRALRVRVGRQSWIPEALAEGTVEVTPAGEFRLELADPGERPLHLMFTVEGDERSRPLQERRELGAGSAVLEGLEFALAARGHLEGVVADESGTPLEGVELALIGRDVDPAPVALTDAAGRFRFENVGNVTSLRSERTSWTVLDVSRLEPLERGGWLPAEVTLTSSAPLTIEVVDASERPAAEVTVTVELAPEERSLLTPDGARPGSRRATTGADGLATLDEVWIGRKLLVTLRAGEHWIRCASRSAGELLGERRGEAWQPLVVTDAAGLRLRHRLGGELVLRGTVLLEGGRPVPEAHVEVSHSEHGENARPTRLASTKADEQGRFELRIALDRVRSDLRVLATDRAEREQKGFAQRPLFDHAVSQLVAAPVEVERGSGAERELELVLAPMLTISGTLVGPDGRPLESRKTLFGNRLYAVPAGAGHPFAPDALGLVAEASTEDGRFEIEGLPPGLYDLHVTQELVSFYTFSTSFQVFPGIAAGTHDLRLLFADRELVEAVMAVDTGDEAVSGLIVLIGRYHPRDPRSAPATASRFVNSSSPAAWPLGAPWRFTGAGGMQTEEGGFDFSFYSAKTAEHALPKLGEGWYVFGVEAFGEDGKAWFPVATELVYLGSGEARIELAPPPAARLTGRVHAGRDTARLALRLVDAAGRAVPAQATGRGFGIERLKDLWPLPSSGEFVLDPLPAGEFRLQLGSEEELARGTPLLERKVHIRPGENPPLELRVR